MSDSALSWSHETFLLDGEPFQIISGAIHYFRIHPEQWADRLARLRWLGLNTIDVYVPWNFHEPQSEQFQFDGWRDIVAFVELAAAHDFKVLLRPGPYIAAEWDFGGFPAWLLTHPDLVLRSNEPTYQGFVARWFEQLLPRLAPLQHEQGGPIIAVQVENEYGTYGDDPAHLRWLADLIRAQGIDSMLFCNSGVESEGMLRGGSVPEVLTTVDFDGPPDAPFGLLGRIQQDRPLLCSEHWIGWFDHWGEHHHRVDGSDVAGNLDVILAWGASVNLYMAAGGTNFGWTAGATLDPKTGGYRPITTSYDYDAPIAEDGTLTDKAHQIRDVIARHFQVPVVQQPDPPRRLAPRSLTPHRFRPLFDSLDLLGTWSRSVAPVPMERLGQHQGLVVYRTTIRGPRTSQPLTVHGLADHAWIYLDGHLIGTLTRDHPSGLLIEVMADSAQLDVLVDATGRVNYGPFLRDPKGIAGPVLIGPQALFDWSLCSLPLDNLTELPEPNAFEYPVTDDQPLISTTTCHIDEPADAHLDLPQSGRALIWLNGFCLGRHWATGPVRTLYAPTPLWRPGANDITVLDLDGRHGPVELRSQPQYG